MITLLVFAAIIVAMVVIVVAFGASALFAIAAFLMPFLDIIVAGYLIYLAIHLLTKK